MARISRIVVPGLPHHVTQRGNHQQDIFLSDDDYRVYRSLMAQSCKRSRVKVWAYCLMPNHVHMIMEPATEDGLALAVGEAHRRYSSYLNARLGQTGHVFQGRFNSRVMDEPHAQAAIRYVALNPVKAGLVKKAEDWPWASTTAALRGEGDQLATVEPVLERLPDLARWLKTEDDIGFAQLLESDNTIGRPMMMDDELTKLEDRLGRDLKPRPRGRPPKNKK